MSLHEISRRVALKIPRLKRFYDYVGTLRVDRDNFLATTAALGEAHAALSESHSALSESHSALSESHDALRESYNKTLDDLARVSERLTNAGQKCDELKLERDRFELALYALRSDYNRAINISEQRLDALREAEARAEPLQRDLLHLDQAPEATDQDLIKLRQGDGSAKQAAQPTGGPISLGEIQRSVDRAHVQLLSRLSILSAEVNDLRRKGNGSGNSSANVRLRYLDLLECALTGILYDDRPISPWSRSYDPNTRMIGRDWPATAQTMIGTTRMRNIRSLSESIIDSGVKGDFLEAGAWRGGACIYMRGILAAYNESERKVWVADSFSGLPPPNPVIYPADAGEAHHTFTELVVPLEEVKANFAKFALLDDQVVFLPGWFKDTLPAAPIEKLALLRIDGDMYQSTMETLESLYFKLSPGGCVIIDDYILERCKKATNDFRKRYNVLEPLEDIDGAGVYWRKQS